jgi:tetraacyldisaccharide 4'-kinase
VRLDEPSWWYGGSDDIRQRALAPLGWLYGWIAERRYRRRQPYRSRLPVICVGNLTAGGTGKTPLSIFIARLLIANGERPVFLTRGYGGRTAGPAWVDEAPGAARLYGDEPLLLASVAPTLVARDRRAGIMAIEQGSGEPTVVVMDDGLQNPAVAKDLAIALVDGKRGIGNGEVIPAGPLRAPLDFQITLTDAVVVRDPPPADAGRNVHGVLRRGFPGPVLAARVVARGDASWIAARKLVAYAGIADPQRFYATLEKLGGDVVERVSFPDHHAFTGADADRLIATAQARRAMLVTTEKDFVRLIGEETLAGLMQATRTLPVEMTFEERDLIRLKSLIEAALQGTTRRPRPPPPR